MFRVEVVTLTGDTWKPNFIYLVIFFNHSNLAGWLTTHFSVVCQTQNTYLFLLYMDFNGSLLSILPLQPVLRIRRTLLMSDCTMKNYNLYCIFYNDNGPTWREIAQFITITLIWTSRALLVSKTPKLLHTWLCGLELIESETDLS